MPPDPSRGSRLRRSYLKAPLNKYSCQYEHPSKNLSYAPGFKIDLNVFFLNFIFSVKFTIKFNSISSLLSPPFCCIPQSALLFVILARFVSLSRELSISDRLLCLENFPIPGSDNLQTRPKLAFWGASCEAEFSGNYLKLWSSVKDQSVWKTTTMLDAFPPLLLQQGPRETMKSQNLRHKIRRFFFANQKKTVWPCLCCNVLRNHPSAASLRTWQIDFEEHGSRLSELSLLFADLYQVNTDQKVHAFSVDCSGFFFSQLDKKVWDSTQPLKQRFH